MHTLACVNAYRSVCVIDRKSREEVSDASTLHKLYMVEQICSGTSTVSEMYDFLGNQGKLPADVREKVFSYKEAFGFLSQNQSISDFIVEVGKPMTSFIYYTY